MRPIWIFLLLLLTGPVVIGQGVREGTISYITSQHVYVKFSSMEGISQGDTLYIGQGDREVPALQVLDRSSTSCVCVPLKPVTFEVSGAVYARPDTDAVPESVQEPVTSGEAHGTGVADSLATEADSIREKQSRQRISGRLSVSSYTNFSNPESDGSQRMRYTFSMSGNNLGSTRFSAETYLSFVHTSDEWEEVKENVFNGLKIYNLSVKYDISESMHISFGRKINPRLSSVGAIDGLQFEKRFSSLTLGAFAGSRPDYEDYGINLDLMQFGMYLGHELSGTNGKAQSTVAFIEQMNQSQTDRRFAYFQHSNMLVKNLFFFGSAEIDLYKKVNDTKQSTLDFSNAYLSLRYRIIRPLSISLSYSARNNVIYYETYKDFLDRLLETEALQGWRGQVNYHPVKNLYAGISGGYRFRKEDPKPSQNLYGYITYSQVPGIGGSVTLSTTWLETSYLNGMVYGLAISRDLIQGKLSAELKYRYVDYLYKNAESDLVQHVGDANLSWKVLRQLFLSVCYEGTFEDALLYHRLYVNLSQRF
jgi:hypothetical protein